MDERFKNQIAPDTTGGSWPQPLYPTPTPCPSCGYCPHCGRGGRQTLPYYPWYPYTNPNTPYWPNITWTTSTYTGGLNGS